MRAARPTDRVMLWRMDSPDGESRRIWIGALEDGTIFQKLGEQRWHVVMWGGANIDEAFSLVIEMTRRNEHDMLLSGPVEFSVGRKTADDIREDVNWNESELSLMIGFDMALRAER